MTIIQVCGYKRTGKDTFFDIISKKVSQIVEHKSGETQNGIFTWAVYKRQDDDTSITCKNSKYIKKAFADELKREASEEYSIPLNISDDEKDIKKLINHKTGELVSARDIYIEWGKYRRSQDVNYWCKKVINSINQEDDNTYVITDWRFLNENNYMCERNHKVVTVRLFRTDVEVPDITIESEHQLDQFQTNFLLIRNNVPGEFEKAVQLFPQYGQYVMSEYL